MEINVGEMTATVCRCRRVLLIKSIVVNIRKSTSGMISGVMKLLGKNFDGCKRMSVSPRRLLNKIDPFSILAGKSSQLVRRTRSACLANGTSKKGI